MVWGENLPSGRERAIETLIDMEPQGSFYRAARLLEESVPQALLHRPNLVTKAALVEEAYALSKHEIDQLSKYDDAFGLRDNACFSDHTVSLPLAQKGRILKHHDKIMIAKGGKTKSSISPSPRLVAALRRVYGEGESSLVLRSLLQSVMDHPAFAKEEEGPEDDNLQGLGLNQLESLVASISRNDGKDADLLHGLLISVLSVLTANEESKDTEKEFSEELDPSQFQALQVGAILSTIKPEEDDKSNWNLDAQLLDFFGKTAAAYEERIEIQKARLMARFDKDKEENQNDSFQTPITTQQLSQAPTPGTGTNPAATPTAATPQPAATPDAVAIPDDEQDLNAAAAAISAAIFEQIANAAAGEDTSSNEEEGDFSGSNSEGDYDYGAGQQGLENDSSSSSSSSSSSEEPDEDDHNHVSDDDDMNLRQALALSLVQGSQSLLVDTSVQEDFVEAETLSAGPVTPGNDTPLATTQPEPNESPLPPLPTPPKYYPYSNLLANTHDNQTQMDCPYFDPALLNHFGALPLPYILVHLLRYSLESIERQKFHVSEGHSSSSSRTIKPTSTVAGGLASSLFPTNNRHFKAQKVLGEKPADVGTSLQLLVALFLLISDRRNDAIENFRKAVTQENKAAQKNDGDEFGRKGDGEISTPERDDPALALALHYLDEDTSESKESLEAKGMRRKAAAAAHDAASLLTSLRRRTNGWKDRVKLYSHCTLLSMRCLRFFLQSVVRRWIHDLQGISALDCHELLPANVISKLSLGLASLSSMTSHKSFVSLLNGSDESVEDVFMALRLYKDSLLAWGECVPIIFPSVNTQVDILKSLLNGCVKADQQSHFRSFENMTSFPIADSELQYHRLHMLCRRLRVGDLLDNFVSIPACYVSDSEEESGVDISRKTSLAMEPNCTSSIIELITSSSTAFGGIKGELQSFYLALCHRYHIRVLLWDGLFACTEPETDEVTALLTPSAGDTVRVEATPSSGLQFDSTKCSDSMVIISDGDGPSAANGSSVHQRASKVWGTVLSSACFSPKTGLHRWAVKLDKCERGHVFIGVATSQASMRTYVGGDKYGWGMIGTQALWHDRRKIRGDYGATFRTGSTIIVTLDTNAGTLNFSSWKDNTSSNSFSLDPLNQNVSSPRRHGHVGGVIEEWGIAFEGLPLDSRLYPAVGLYQRDDRVTLLAVESGGMAGSKENSIDLSGGLCYYPRIVEGGASQEIIAKVAQVRHFNDNLSWNGVMYAVKALQRIIDSIRDNGDEFLWTTLLPSLAAALCLVPPSIPILSERNALALLPELTKCVLELERCRDDRSMVHRLFRKGLNEGKWVIRATGSSGTRSDSEEYVVDISTSTNENGAVVGFEGSGVGTTGKSKNGLVAIFGTVKGSSLHFVEEWTDGNDEGFNVIPSDAAASSCIVNARLSLDGTKFEGTYRNVQFGTTGQIAGLLSREESKVSKFYLKDAPILSKQSSELEGASMSGEALLCLAQSHMATIVSEDAGGDHSYALEKPMTSLLSNAEWNSRRTDLKECLSLSLFSRLSVKGGSQPLLQHFRELQDMYSPPDESSDTIPLLDDNFVRDFIASKDWQKECLPFSAELEDIVSQLDVKLCALSGGAGSLSMLCPSEYQAARLRLICTLLHHCGMTESLKTGVTEQSISSDLNMVWSYALRIMEDGIRKSIAEKAGSTSRVKAADTCLFFGKLSSFFLKLEAQALDPFEPQSAAQDILQIFRLVRCEEDLEFLSREMSRSSKRALLRLIPIHEMINLLNSSSRVKVGIMSPVAIESLAIAIPKLLGRKHSTASGEGKAERKGSKYRLGNHYSSDLPGILGGLRWTLQNTTHDLLRVLCRFSDRAISTRKENKSSEWLVSIDSMLLAILASFIYVTGKEDAEFVLLDSGLFSILPKVLNQHRSSILGPLAGIINEEKISVVKDLHHISCREISRSVLRVAVALIHVITYQTLVLAKQADAMANSLSCCLDVILGEILQVLPLVQGAIADTMIEYRKKEFLLQWDIFSDVGIKWNGPKSLQKQSSNLHQVGRSGVKYLNQHGSVQAIGAPPSTQKPSSRSRGNQQSTSSTSHESTVRFQGNFCHQFLTHWIHILVALTKSDKTREMIARDARWMKVLLNTIGLDLDDRFSSESSTVELIDSKNLLPGRYRCRLLRLLLPLLMKIVPSETIANGLFSLAGSSSNLVSRHLDDDEKAISKEAVSLLRQLHAPGNKSWRSQINKSIHNILTDKKIEDSIKRIGVLHFFNGGIDMISRGSYVLLKPAAAAPLSIEHQTVSGSKSHFGSPGGGPSGMSSMPYHVVGNGTESVIAGLCRADSAAGIVSSIDLKNGACEVILLKRDNKKPEEMSSGGSNLQEGVAFTGSKGSHTSRHTLTVRALRSPLTDVVKAQEIPLFIDDELPIGSLLSGLLQESLSFLESKAISDLDTLEASASDDETGSRNRDEVTLSLEGIRSDILRISEAVMTIRSAITLFSDEKVLLSFLCQPKSQETLSCVLRLAYPDESISFDQVDLHKKYLSSLPAHEARWVHLLSLFRGLNFRVSVFNNTSNNTRHSRLEEYNKRKQVFPSELNGGSSGTGRKDSCKTPLPNSGSAPRTPPAPSATGGISERMASRESESASNREVSRSTAGSDNREGDDDGEAAATAAAHLREAAIAQMAELGLPRSWSELALRRTGGTNIEAAVHFCLERGGEMERLLAEERERMQRQSSGGSSSRRRGNRAEQSNHLLRQLLEMGFPRRWCAEALAATGNNVDEALTWILTNGERLSAEDEGMEDDEDIDDEDNSQDEDESIEGQTKEGTGDEVGVSNNEDSENKSADKSNIPGWTGSIIPLRFISGRSIINPETLAISGLPSGGFSSVGTKGVMLTTGKWYYEAILETAGCLQIGWADGSFSGHCHADRGDGCGDGPSSWAYDGWRRYRWHATATEWGCRWKEGDVIGCMVDMDKHVVSFTLNGRSEEIGMGVAFSGEGFRPCGGVYACVSFNRKEKLKLILGGSSSESFKFSPPDGYRGVGEAVLNAVDERESLIAKELILDQNLSHGISGQEESREDGVIKRFLCDFSDGDHGHELMAWAHRYYGSDASVHLGSGRTKQSSGIQKNASSSGDISTSICLKRRFEQAWKDNQLSDEQLDTTDLSTREFFNAMANGYHEVGKQLLKQTSGECIVMASLLARKFLIHLIVVMGENFDPECCMASALEASKSSLRLWKMLESVTNLRSAGWVGEAGAMAVAAEALGLGISSNDTPHSRQFMTDRSGISSIADLDDGMLIPSGGIVQLLSTVQDRIYDTGTCTSNLVASAEAAFGSDGGGGVLVFLQKGLQGAIFKSEDIRKVILAYIRRAVRRLAVVEYDGEDTSTPTDSGDDDDKNSNPMEKSSGPDESDDEEPQPDARLVSYLTGLLLTPQVEETVDDFEEIQIDLFEAWSVGMLSASLPWRMVCAFTASGILNSCPKALVKVLNSVPTLCRFYGRLESTVSRRMWAERAAAPICSRYSQAMLELLCSVKRSVDLFDLPSEFLKYWNSPAADAAMPLPLLSTASSQQNSMSNWEADDNWISSDRGWEIWTGTVDFLSVDWKSPTRSAVRTLMDGGDGPPMLREGCTVMRGLDWEDDPEKGNEDGNDFYEAEKAKREAEKQDSEKSEEVKSITPSSDAQANAAPGDTVDPTDEGHDPASSPILSEETEGGGTKKKKKKRKLPNPKLPLGTVLSIEPWKGIPAMARRVRWHLTGKEGVYRYGGDGGCYDICHVEVNEKVTRVRKRHPLPESAEQCASRHGFGVEKRHSLLLRLRQAQEQKVVDGEIESHREGIMEWPDFGAGILVDCILHDDGAVTIKEKKLIYGSKDSGWEARFGQASFISGTTVVLSPTGSSLTQDQKDSDMMSPFVSLYEELLGSSTLVVENLRNREDGKKLRLTSEIRLIRGRDYSEKIPSIPPAIQAPLPPPIHFDSEYHASSLSLSQDGRTVSCISSEGRGTAFGSVGFTKGVHYWEVKLEQADIGSVFIGVAEKPTGSGSGSSYGYDTPSRLNRWHGWGFVNFRATYTTGAERIYGAHCHAGDTVGVLLDCDAGRISFFFDGLKYGEHILNDLGCAFENISPFGFNVDGCGSGGAAQGAPSGIEGGRSGRYPAQGAVRPRALWPVVGLRSASDRVTFSPKWISSYGVDGLCTVRNAIAVDAILNCYSPRPTNSPDTKRLVQNMPDWFIREAFSEYRKWGTDSQCRTVTRGSGPYHLASFGLDLELDTSPLACAAANALLGLKVPLLAGDRVRLKRSAGRILELAEEAVVLGAYHGRLFYRVVSQKSEGGSLTEGGGRAWCWDESEVVDGLPHVTSPKCLGIELPLMDRFKCVSNGGLRVVYEGGGAVIRSDLEIFEGSMNLGAIPLGTIIPQKDVLERRVNSCGVVRFRVRFESLEGWISSKIRGGKEEAIVTTVYSKDTKPEVMPSSCGTPLECAEQWYQQYQKKVKPKQIPGFSSSLDVGSFRKLAGQGIVSGLSMAESDAFLVKALGAICDFCDDGNALEAPIAQVATAISFAIASTNGEMISNTLGSKEANHAAATIFASLNKPLPSAAAILTRIAILRSLNRRAKVALPWMSLRPCQEGAALFGGIQGHGASIERAGRYWNTKSRPQQWPVIPSIATKLRSLRGLFFTSVKCDFLFSIIEATTTPTPLSHDEYELPREIRTVRLNRLKARRAITSTDASVKRKHSIFAQLQNETKGWGGGALRRGFVAKGHGGQKRAFKIKLIGEGVNDYSGPYREAFTDALAEILDVDDEGRGTLGVLDPTPNNECDIGENRDLFMFSLNGGDVNGKTDEKPSVSSEERRILESFSSLTLSRDERSREVEEALVFLGRVTGTAVRHGIPLDLPLPLESVWRAIVEESTTELCIMDELDTLASRQLESGTRRSPLLRWQQRMLNSYVEGMSNVLPVEILPILSGEELRDIVCGNPEVDVNLLRRVVEYEGYDESDAVVQFFWETLREFTNDERKRFLQFVWARNRLPMKESDFDAPFKIQRDSSNKNGDQALPSASTCFFSLTLPEYSSKELLKGKLLFAINNVTTMETDFQTNSAEIAEGYRAF